MFQTATYNYAVWQPVQLRYYKSEITLYLFGQVFQGASIVDNERQVMHTYWLSQGWIKSFYLRQVISNFAFAMKYIMTRQPSLHLSLLLGYACTVFIQTSCNFFRTKLLFIYLVHV